jgi:hypothetical protein
MQTRTSPIRLLDLVAKKSIAFERAINRITLDVLQLPCGNELFAVDGEFGAHPIYRQRTARSVNENKTGDLPVDRKNFECSIRTQPPGEVLRQTKRKMRLRKLKIDSRFAVNPASFDVLHCKLFSTPESRAMPGRTCPRLGSARASRAGECALAFTNLIPRFSLLSAASYIDQRRCFASQRRCDGSPAASRFYPLSSVERRDGRSNNAATPALCT